MAGHNHRGPAKTHVCTRCGIAIAARRKLGLCYDCYLDAHAGRTGRYRLRGRSREYGTCMVCKRRRLVPTGKDKRWFRCDTCQRYLEGEGFLAGDSFVGRGNIHVPSRGMWRR